MNNDKQTAQIERIANCVDSIRHMVAYIGLIALVIMANFVISVVSIKSELRKIEANISSIERALVPPTPIRVIEAEEETKK